MYVKEVELQNTLLTNGLQKAFVHYEEASSIDLHWTHPLEAPCGV